LWSDTQGELPCLVAFARVEKAWIRVRTSARDAACHLCAAARVQAGVSAQHDPEERVAGFLQLTENCNDAQPVPEAYLVRRSALQLMRAWRMSALITEIREIKQESDELRDEYYMDGVDPARISDAQHRIFYARASYADTPDLLDELNMAIVAFERDGQMDLIASSWPACDPACEQRSAVDPDFDVMGYDSRSESVIEFSELARRPLTSLMRSDNLSARARARTRTHRHTHTHTHTHTLTLTHTHTHTHTYTHTQREGERER
jgi:hypothetical protein